MKLGIVGSRRRNDAKDFSILLKKVLDLNPEMIISGGCAKGADRFAEDIARRLGIPILIYYPKLKQTRNYKYHEIVKANYARNMRIAVHSDHLIALVAPDRKGGTENTIEYFKRHGMGEEELEIL